MLDRASVVRRADAFAREGKLDQAAAEYRALVEENPGDSGAANSLGDLYARLGDPARAIEQYTNLGEAEWLQGFSAKAAAFYKKALKVDPNCESALLRLGEIAASQSLRVEAARHWKRLRDRRAQRGDAAGEAEVAGWLADLETRPSARQATSVGMTPRLDTRSVTDAAVPLGTLDPSESTMSSQTTWEAALMAAPSEGRPSMAAALAAMSVDETPLVVEHFAQAATEPASEPPPDDGFVTVNGVAADLDSVHLVESQDADPTPGATHPATESADAVQDDAPARGTDAPVETQGAAVEDDWEIVVEMDDDVDMTAALVAAEAFDTTDAPIVNDAPAGTETEVAVESPVEMPVAIAAVDAAEAFEAEADPAPLASGAALKSFAPEAVAQTTLISELTAAADTPNLRFQAAAQLGRIFLQRGDLDRGIEWLERACGVTAPVRDHGLLARYDLADALERAGERSRALDVLSDLEMDAGSYRDVSVRITRLSRATGSAP